MINKIEFPKYCDALNLEEKIFNNFNSAIKNCNSNNFTIDMRYIQWIDLFTLTNMILIISAFSKQCKNINIILPACYSLENDPSTSTIENVTVDKIYNYRKNVCSFLDRWGFLDIINSYNNISTDIDKNRYEVWSKSLESRLSFVLELTSIDLLHKLKNTRTLLKDENRVKNMFHEFSSLSVIESGKFANIIIWELGLNISEHAKPNNGYLTIHVVREIDKDIENSTEINRHRIEYSTAWEKQFFTNNNYEGYIEVVISDDGLGILNTLKDNYCDVFDIDEKDIKECDILEWAFTEMSSCKPEKRYKGSTKTGLYWVMMTLSDYGGYLSLRSGHSIISYDFSNDNNISKPYKDSNLVHFQGTQILIRIPLKDNALQKRVTQKIQSDLDLSKFTKEKINLWHIELIKSTSEEAIIAELKKFDKYRIKFQTYQDIIYLDFSNVDLDKNELDTFFQRLYTLGESSSIIIINFDYSLISVLETTTVIKLFSDNNQLLLIFSSNLEPYLLGGDNAIYKVIEFLNDYPESTEVDFKHYLLESQALFTVYRDENTVLVFLQELTHQFLYVV